MAGSALVLQLLASPAWVHVTTVGRRAGAAPPAEHAAKLTQSVVDMDALATGAGPAFAGADVAFCALGTKRRVAGSAAAYVKARSRALLRVWLYARRPDLAGLASKAMPGTAACGRGVARTRRQTLYGRLPKCRVPHICALLHGHSVCRAAVPW